MIDEMAGGYTTWYLENDYCKNTILSKKPPADLYRGLN